MYAIGIQHAPVPFTTNPPINGLTYSTVSSNGHVISLDMGNPDDLSGYVQIGDDPGDLPAGANVTVEGRDSGGILKARSVDGFVVIAGGQGPNYITFNPVLV